MDVLDNIMIGTGLNASSFIIGMKYIPPDAIKYIIAGLVLEIVMIWISAGSTVTEQPQQGFPLGNIHPHMQPNPSLTSTLRPRKEESSNGPKITELKPDDHHQKEEDEHVDNFTTAIPLWTPPNKFTQ